MWFPNTSFLGISEGITGMRVDEMRRIFIPASLGYLNKPDLPENSPIVYGASFRILTNPISY